MEVVSGLVLPVFGGFVGAICRYEIENGINAVLTSSFPVATILVNVVGCFIAGFLFPLSGLKAYRLFVGPFIVVGFCGSLTTFSSYGREVVNLLIDASTCLVGFGTAFATLSLCFGSVIAGYYISNRFVVPRLPEESEEFAPHTDVEEEI